MRVNPIAEAAIAEQILDSLTPVQSQVMDRVVSRLNSKEIARELNVSPNTVDQRVRAAILKIGASDRDDAARRYVELHRRCGRTICGSSVIDVLVPADEEPLRELPRTPHFVLADSMASFPSECEVREQTFLEVIDRRFGRIGRLGLIVILAVLLAILVLTTTAIGTTLSNLV